MVRSVCSPEINQPLALAHLGGLPDPGQRRVLGRRQKGAQQVLQPVLLLLPVLARKEGGDVPDVRAVEEREGAQQQGPQRVVARGIVARQHRHGREQRWGGQPQEARRVLARQHAALCGCGWMWVWIHVGVLGRRPFI